MKLVYHYIVEVVRRKDLQMLVAAQGLHSGEVHAGVFILALTCIQPKSGLRANGPEYLMGLVYDLLPVGEKEDPSKLCRVEGSQVGLAHTGSCDYQSLVDAFLTGSPQVVERLNLRAAGSGRGVGRRCDIFLCTAYQRRLLPLERVRLQ
ncbi:MAG: hypothetical protein BWY92_01478 [Firmicutes bacterium ADurb.BinA052]|nr:MAG: hypothetical protein BWY92_01478 [Firmicutes bacterium ADurb.BinA052]